MFKNIFHSFNSAFPTLIGIYSQPTLFDKTPQKRLNNTGFKVDLSSFFPSHFSPISKIFSENLSKIKLFQLQKKSSRNLKNDMQSAPFFKLLLP